MPTSTPCASVTRSPLGTCVASTSRVRAIAPSLMVGIRGRDRRHRRVALHPPAGLGREVDRAFLHPEAARLQQVADPLAAAHRVAQAAGEELDVLLVRVEVEAAIGDIAGELLV